MLMAVNLIPSIVILQTLSFQSETYCRAPELKIENYCRALRQPPMIEPEELV